MSPFLRAVALSLFSTSLFAQVSLTTNGTAATQDFDSLASAGSSAVTPTGWAFAESGTSANNNGLYVANNGAANGGDTYSFGATGVAERAFGGLQSGTLIPTVGGSFVNNTGGAITALDIAYFGEQWRLGTTGRAVPDQLDFQYSLDATSLTTGTWVDVNALDFVTANPTAAVGALDGNLPANRTLRSANIPGLNIAGSAIFWIRWNSVDATGADDGLSVDDFSITPQGAGNATSISVSDVTVTEGNSGTVIANFTVSLSAPAASAVTFTISTQDASATVANNDYVARSLANQTIAVGQQTFTFAVTVNGDTAVEPTETFLVNLSAVSGAIVADGQGVGTISNDDVVVIPISTVQGSGAASTLAGSSVTIEGIVTARKNSGFFVQTPDANIDGNAATSEAIFVFIAPPAAAAVGNRVQVTGTVVEFIPPSEPNQPPTTELVGPITVTQLSTGNALPAPIAITAINPAGAFDQLERFEHMRVSFAGSTVSSPTGGFVSEPNATGTSNGVFWMTLSGVPRPQREPGIDVRFPLPAGAPAGVPRFDANPESIRVDSDSQISALALNLASGQTIGAWVGVLDYGFLAYTFIPDPGQTPVISAAPAPNVATAALADEFTVVSYNVQRFFDTVNDPAISDPVLTAVAFQNRLNKISRQIRQNLGSPDIVSLIEVENLSTLQAIAAQISTDGGPTYSAHLIEGNDVGGIDVAYLVKTSPVSGATPRVTVLSVTQEGATATFTNPTSGNQDLLNDRPPLLLRATVNSSTGGSSNVTVLVNHLRSFVGADGPVDGPRIRAKRRAQAEFVANLVQARQVADPNERIVVLGDFNAYEFNDGFVDSIGTIIGAPAPASMVISPSADLVNPNLTLLQDATPALRYSYLFDGNTQSIDHLLVNQGLINGTLARRMEHIRFNADYPEIARNDITSNTRLSDHDALLGFFRVASLGTPTASVAVSPATINELAAPTASTITVTLSFAPTSATTVNLNYTGTAVRATDFNAPLSILVPANASTATAQLVAIDDSLVEPNETAILTVAAGTGYTPGVPLSATVTIQSKDVIPVASFTVSPLSINELGAPTSSVVSVTLSPTPTQAGSLSFVFAGSATRTADYSTTGLTGDSLSFVAGQSTLSFTINAIDDAIVEPTETVLLSFGTLTGATAGTPNTATVNIVNDDVPVATLTLSPSTINEVDFPRSATLTVTLSQAALVPTTVNLSYAGAAIRGTDFDAPLSILIAAGQTTGSAQITVIDDAMFEVVEVALISIAPGVGYTAGANVPVSLSITSNDLYVSQIPTLDNAALLAMLMLLMGFGMHSLRRQQG